MRTKLIEKTVSPVFAWNNSGDTERLEYECPCGKGKIIEEHDNIPGNRDHDVWIDCPHCAKKYTLDTSKGIRNWDLVTKTKNVKIKYEGKEIETNTLYKYSLNKDTCEIVMTTYPIYDIVESGGSENIELLDVGFLLPIYSIGKIVINNMVYLPVNDINKATNIIRDDLQTTTYNLKVEYLQLKNKYLKSKELLKRFDDINEKSGN